MSVPEIGQINTDDIKFYNPGLVAFLLVAPGDATHSKRRY
jgi:hypothetical protein